MKFIKNRLKHMEAEEKKDENVKPKHSRKQWLFTSLVIFIILFIGAVELVHYFNEPTQGLVETGASTVPGGYSINLTPHIQIGHYASFSYPSGLTTQTADVPKPPILEEFNYKGKDVVTWILGIDIASLPASDIKNNSSYTYRLAHPEIYQLSTIQVNGHPVIVATDKTASGFSKVAFLIHGPYIATVALSGDDPTGTSPLQQSFSLVLSSWHWLK